MAMPVSGLVLAGLHLVSALVFPQADAGGSQRVAAPSPRLDASGCEPWPEGGHEVHVVRSGTREPVPSAVVRFFPKALEPVAEQDFYTGDGSRERWQGERRFRADGEGKVVLPGLLAWAVGSAPGLWGQGWVGPGSQRTLELYPDVPVLVRVLDARGSPAPDMPVELLLLEQDGDVTGVSARSGEDGLARFDHVPYHAAMPGVRCVAVGLAIPLVTPVQRDVDPAHVPTAPVELRVPPCGILELRLADSRGANLPSPARVLVWPDDPTSQVDPEHPREPRLPESRTRHVQAHEGVQRIPVGLGLNLHVLVDAHGGFGKTERRVRGPERAGEVVPVAFTLAPRTLALAGRLLHPDGRPVANTTFHLHLDDRLGESTTRPAGERFVTDAEGCFHEQLGSEHPEKVAALRFRSENGQLSPPVDVALPVVTPLTLGENDLGTLTVAPIPALLAGRVVDRAGEPVEDAIVFVSRRVAAGWRLGERWDRDLDPRTGTDAHGRFVLHARTEADDVQVTAMSPSSSPELRIRVRPPGADVVLVVGGTGELAGTLRTDEGERVLGSDVEAVREDGDARIGHVARVNWEGEFHIDELPAGRYRLRVLHPLTGQELLSIPGIEVREGRCMDPRLAVVDVHGLTGGFEITVLDRHGRPLPESGAHYRASDDVLGAVLPARLVGPGRFRVANGGARVDVLAWAAGHRTAVLERIDSASSVTLDEGIPVRFRFAGCDGFSAHELAAEVSVFAPERDHLLALRPIPFDERGEAAVRLPEAGAYRVSCSWHRPAESKAVLCASGAPPAPSIEVLDEEHEQVFRLELERGDGERVSVVRE